VPVNTAALKTFAPAMRRQLLERWAASWISCCHAE
jgi:hypothetical protein